MWCCNERTILIYLFSKSRMKSSPLPHTAATLPVNTMKYPYGYRTWEELVLIYFMLEIMQLQFKYLQVLNFITLDFSG